MATACHQRSISNEMETIKNHHNCTSWGDQDIMGNQLQQMEVYHSLCIYVSENIVENGWKDGESQELVVKQSLLKMAA